jgi:hypothetical protein
MERDSRLSAIAGHADRTARSQAPDLEKRLMRSIFSEVACELATNAVAASSSSGTDSLIQLRLLSDGERVLILVRDDSPDVP